MAKKIILRGTLEDHQGNSLHPSTEAGQVAAGGGKTVAQRLLELTATAKEYTANSSTNAAVVVGVSDFVQPDTADYTYSLELLSAVSGAEENLGIVPVLHLATQSVVLNRVGITSGKSVDVVFRITRRAL